MASSFQTFNVPSRLEFQFVPYDVSGKPKKRSRPKITPPSVDEWLQIEHEGKSSPICIKAPALTSYAIDVGMFSVRAGHFYRLILV
jgi:hypothetical protein